MAVLYSRSMIASLIEGKCARSPLLEPNIPATQLVAPASDHLLHQPMISSSIPIASPSTDANLAVNSLNISFGDHLSSSDNYLSFSSSNYDVLEYSSDYNHGAASSSQDELDSSSDSSSDSCLKINSVMLSSSSSLERSPAKLEEPWLSVASTVPFKWEEAPGKPINILAACRSANMSQLVEKIPEKTSHHSPLQLPPKLQRQAHNQALQSPACHRELPVNDGAATGLQAFLHLQSPLPLHLIDYIESHSLQPLIEQLSPHIILHPGIDRCPHRLQAVHQSCSFESQPTYPSPYILQQKLKKVCRSLLRSASFRQPLHRMNPTFPAWSSFGCHGSSADEEESVEENEKIARYDRFFFDRACPKDLTCNASAMDSAKPTLPIFDESQREDVFFRNIDALRLLALAEDHEPDQSMASSQWQPSTFHGREGDSGSYSWAPDSLIAGRHGRDDDDDDNDRGFHDFFSPASLSGKVSQRSEDEYSTESPCSSTLPWFLDFSPQEEENHQVVESKATRKMNLVRLVALIKIKSIIMGKLRKLRRRRRRRGGAHKQENSMWSPTLATYLYNNLQTREVAKEISTASLDHSRTENVQEDSSDKDCLRINYRLPSSVRGEAVCSRRYLSDDELLSPARRAHQGRLMACMSRSLSSTEQQQEATHMRLSLREKLAEFNNDEYVLDPTLCAQETMIGSPHQVITLKTREHPHQYAACKGMCKLQRTVQALSTTMKVFLVQADACTGKGERREKLKVKAKAPALRPSF